MCRRAEHDGSAGLWPSSRPRPVSADEAWLSCFCKECTGIKLSSGGRAPLRRNHRAMIRYECGKIGTLFLTQLRSADLPGGGRDHATELLRRLRLRPGELQPALRNRSGRWFAFAGDLHGWEREFDAVLVEGLFDHRIGLAPDDELLARQGHHLRSDRDGVIAELVDPLHLERLEDQRPEFGVLLQIEPDLLDQLLGKVDVTVIRDADRDLVDYPVAAHVLDRTQQDERHGEDRAAVMPQPDRTNAEAFDWALIAAGLHVFADPEGVVHQIEHAGDHIAGESLRAKADCDTDDARAGNERTDLNPQRRQRHHRADGDDDDEQDIAKNR